MMSRMNEQVQQVPTQVDHKQEASRIQLTCSGSTQLRQENHNDALSSQKHAHQAQLVDHHEETQETRTRMISLRRKTRTSYLFPTSILIAATILSHLRQLPPATLTFLLSTSSPALTKSAPNLDLFRFPGILFAGASECTLDGDCGNKEKICHESKCICARDRPIEDQDRCLTLALINEPCTLSEQCLGNSLCMDGVCSCGNEGISLYNPSSKIFYCHPKRRLNEECNYDSQCPLNSYCSLKKAGCLCHNGYTQATVLNFGQESKECVEKYCRDSSNCESDIYVCDENKCKCLATHFDPHKGTCYTFGSTGGKPSETMKNETSGFVGVEPTQSKDGDILDLHSFIKDLMENSDKMWLVLLILISISILLFVLIFMLIRGLQRGYCWTARKKEYEPNNKNHPTSKVASHFNKNSINNKSFRQKSSDDMMNDDEDNNNISNNTDVAEDRSNLVTASSTTTTNTNRNINTDDKKRNGSSGCTPFVTKIDKTSSQHNYVKVNINEKHLSDKDSTFDNRSYHNQTSPLASSTSTPV